jgi:hypothetical protein
MNVDTISEKCSPHDKITRRLRRRVRPIAEPSHAAAKDLQVRIRARSDEMYGSRRVPVDQAHSEFRKIALDVDAIAKIASAINPRDAEHIERLRARVTKRIERLRALDILPMWALRPQLSELGLDINDLTACAWTFPT